MNASRLTSAVRVSFVAIVPCALALATACAPTHTSRLSLDMAAAFSTQEKPAGSGTGSSMGISDPRDYYYYEGKPVPLNRSLTEYVVRFKAGALPGERKRIETLAGSMALGPEVLSEGRTFQMVTFPAPPDGRAAAVKRFESLRADPDVEFAAPFYYRAGTVTALIPTDDILVKLRLGGTTLELSEITDALGLTVVKTMPGTRDEFVLRLKQPKTADPLQKARALFETGRFLWVEPNFIQDFRNGSRRQGLERGPDIS